MIAQRLGMLVCCSCSAVLLVPAKTASAQGVAARLVFTVQPSAAAVETKIKPAVQVTVQDSSGQTVTSFTGNVTLAITEGTGNEEAELTGTATVAAVAGVADFPDLSIDEPGSAYTLTATAPGVTAATSAAFDIATTLPTAAAARDSPPPAAVPPTLRLVFSVQPSNAAEEGTIAPAVQVTAQDSSGATATSFTGEVTVAITPGTGDSEAELSGTTTVAAVDGIATFPTLSIDNAASGYTLTATA
ncbi:MAG TPA: hypothetical protein VLB49_04195, partial [Gemmatimonadales bacterium]|nr:hypothetical protein [Gemmatimonadales bacterium]